MTANSSIPPTPPKKPTSMTVYRICGIFGMSVMVAPSLSSPGAAGSRLKAENLWRSGRQMKAAQGETCWGVLYCC